MTAKLRVVPPPKPVKEPVLNKDLPPRLRARLRAKVLRLERPPGSALGSSPHAEVVGQGRNAVTVHDLIGMSPLALRRDR
jgi:hypothetical protein